MKQLILDKREQMNNHRSAGLIVTVISIITFITLFNSSSQASVIDWPVETYMALVFTIGWFSHSPIWLAYVLAALLLILIIIGIYKVGSWVYGLIARRA